MYMTKTLQPGKHQYSHPITTERIYTRTTRYFTCKKFNYGII